MENRFADAVALAESGMLEDAKSRFEEILLDDPKNPDVLYNLGMCFTELGEPQKAVTALRKSIEYNPEHSNSYVALGYAYDRLGDVEASVKNLLEALTIDPDNPYAMRNLGGVFGKSGDTEQALSYLQRACKLNPSDAATVYGLAYCCQQSEDYQKADQYYRRVLEMDASSSVKELARDGLREIAATHLRSKGLRMWADIRGCTIIYAVVMRERILSVSGRSDNWWGGLPNSAHNPKYSWWGNEYSRGRVHAFAWLSAGYEARVIWTEEAVVFTKSPARQIAPGQNPSTQIELVRASNRQSRSKLAVLKRQYYSQLDRSAVRIASQLTRRRP